MGLERASITNIFTGRVTQVMFNPEEYTVERGNSFAQLDVPGLSTPPLQFVKGSGSTLTMELFFDSTDSRDDVRRKTRDFTSLLDKDPTAGSPPVLLFTWGGLNYRCVLEKVTQRYTMFREDGAPIRATLSVTFREYDDDSSSPPQQGLPDKSQANVYVVKQGQTLSQISGELYGDPAKWRKLADANPDVNPLEPRQGYQLVLP
jgi:LysM repeat protein